MLEVEDWTQSTQANKRRASSKKAAIVLDVAKSEVLISPSHSPELPTIPPGPPHAEVENAFSATQPPTSHLFPVRTRANSSPSAGPSSLSRLLAQASTENGLEANSPSPERSLSPPTPPPPPPAEVAVAVSAAAAIPPQPSRRYSAGYYPTALYTRHIVSEASTSISPCLPTTSPITCSPPSPCCHADLSCSPRIRNNGLPLA